MANALGNIWGAISSHFSDMFGAMRAALQNAIGTAVNIMNNLPGALASALGGLAGAVHGAISSGLSGIKGWVLNAFSGASSWLLSIGSSIISGLISGINNAVGSGLKAAVQSIPGKIKSWKGPEPYDRQLLVPTGGWIMGGLIEGIGRHLPNLQAKLGDVTKMISGTGGTMSAGLATKTGAFSRPADVAGHPRKIILRIGKREFEAYVEEIADDRIDSSDALAWQGS
jgi:phage-related protein